MRILLLSDIHANYEALEACLNAAPQHDVVMNLGDIVGYGASPNEVAERCREIGERFVRGNHDKAVTGVGGIEDFNPLAAQAALWTRERLTPENLEWLRNLPHGPLQWEGLPEVQFAHGSPLDEDEYIVSVSEAELPLKTSPALTFIGHTHIQGVFSREKEAIKFERPGYKTSEKSENVDFILRTGARYLVNPGSVGQPRDGDWRAAFAVFDSNARVITFCRTPYNVSAAQERILAAQLPSRLASRLSMGR